MKVDPQENKLLSSKLIRVYYLATPVFLAIELRGGLGFRVPFLLAGPGLRYSYYAMCFAFGLSYYIRPGLMPIAALLESSINIILLIVGYMYTIMDISWIFEGTEGSPKALTTKGILGFCVSGFVWIIAFKRSKKNFYSMIRNWFGR